MNNVTLLMPFNPMEHDPTLGSGGNLPIGRHKVVMAGADIKGTKDEKGGMLVLSIQIIEGQFAGTTGVDRLNIYNENVQTVQIAQKRLSAYCHAVNVFQLGADGKQVSALFNIPFYIDVGPQSDPKYTEIKKIYDINGNEPKGQGQQTAPQQQPANNGGFNQQPANNGGWGAGATSTQVDQNQNVQQQNPNPSGWGNQNVQHTTPQQQPNQQQNPAAGWNQNQPANNGGAAPWGQR